MSTFLCEWCNEKRAAADLFCNGCGRGLCDDCSRDDPDGEDEDNEPFGGSICPGCDDEIAAEHEAHVLLCPVCKGKSYLRDDDCPRCGGVGTIPSAEEVAG